VIAYVLKHQLPCAPYPDTCYLTPDPLTRATRQVYRFEEDDIPVDKLPAYPNDVTNARDVTSLGYAVLKNARENRMADLKVLFDLMDLDGDGIITPSELAAYGDIVAVDEEEDDDRRTGGREDVRKNGRKDGRKGLLQTGQACSSDSDCPSDHVCVLHVGASENTCLNVSIGLASANP